MTDDLGDGVDSRNSLPQYYASEPAIHFAYAKKHKSQIITKFTAIVNLFIIDEIK